MGETFFLNETIFHKLSELGLAPVLVEGWLGHKHPGALAVTRRHYLKRASVEALRPLADALDWAMA